MIQTRLAVLKSLIRLVDPIDELKNDLSHFSWDSEEELVQLTVSDLTSVLKRYIDGILNEKTLAEWANAIECRDDIGFEKSSREALKDAINVLANPDLNGPLDRNKAIQMKHSLTAA
jgi:hypothetical protein